IYSARTRPHRARSKLCLALPHASCSNPCVVFIWPKVDRTRDWPRRCFSHQRSQRAHRGTSCASRFVPHGRRSRTMSQLQQHPLSAAFNSMPAAELDALAEDIKLHGQHQPGVLFEDKVLDGWHRYLACERAGVEFKTYRLNGEDPVAFVISANEKRRH